MSTPSRCSRLLIAATIVATTASLSAVASLENGPVAAATSGSFTQLDPVRLLDTRSGDKIGELDGSGTATQLQVTGTNGIPTSGITAIALNVTAVATEANDYGGYVTVYPCGTPPDTSNLNFVSGQTIPNSVIAPVSTTGKVCFYVYGKAHLLADISGYFTTSGTEETTGGTEELAYLGTAARIGGVRSKSGVSARENETNVLVGLTSDGEVVDISDRLDLRVERIYSSPGDSATVLHLTSPEPIGPDGALCMLAYLPVSNLPSTESLRCIDETVTQLEERSFTDRPSYNRAIQFDDEGRVWYVSNLRYLKRWDPATGTSTTMLSPADFSDRMAVYNYVTFTQNEAEQFGAIAMAFGVKDECNETDGGGGQLSDGTIVDSCRGETWLFARIDEGEGAVSVDVDERHSLPQFIKVFGNNLYTTFDDTGDPDNDRWGIYGYNRLSNEFDEQVITDYRREVATPDGCTGPSVWTVCLAPQQAWGYFLIGDGVVSAALSSGERPNWEWNLLVPLESGRAGYASAINATATLESTENRTQGIIRADESGVFIWGVTEGDEPVLSFYDPDENTEVQLIGGGAQRESAQISLFVDDFVIAPDSILIFGTPGDETQVVATLDRANGEVTVGAASSTFTDLDNVTPVTEPTR